VETRMRHFGAEVDRAICPSTGTGLSFGVGFARIGALHKSNSRSTWGSSSLCTRSASEAKRCLVRSVSCWSHKTLESNMRVARKEASLNHASLCRYTPTSTFYKLREIERRPYT
jgi:hypothetical protein